MYKYRDEDVCVNEAIANAVDAFRENSILGGKIDITFDRTDDYGYITFHNNAPPMTKDQFITKYHTVSFSFKKKGQGIGFAGVGAKLFLASEHGGEIITITGKGKRSKNLENPYVSETLGILKNSVPNHIKNNIISKKIIDIVQADEKNGGEGAFFIYLKK